jgi:hypothetical protein
MIAAQDNGVPRRTAAWLAVQVTGVLLSLGACSRSAPDTRRPTVEQQGEHQVRPSMWTGSFHLLWGDPGPPQPGSPQVRYQLVTDGGQVISLLAADSVLAAFGGPRGLDGKRVTVTGAPSREHGGVVRVHALRLARPQP